MKYKTPAKTGTARMRELGYIRVEIWLTPDQVKALVKLEHGWRRTLAGKCRGILRDTIISQGKE